MAGLALLVGGAEFLVRGAARLAAAAGISPLIIGLTVVAFGTSSPELAVSLQAALGGRADLALGNVIGSNIFNVLFILGISALITPLVVSRQLIRLDVPVMILTAAAVILLAVDGRVGRLDGALLVAGGVAYTWFLVALARREGAAGAEPREAGSPARRSPGMRFALVSGGLVATGLAMLGVGSRWLVEGATQIARAAGLSELAIGLTVVAAGTSLPEVATSVVAALRGQRDIAVGNVVGSNIFNVLLVLGASAAVAPAGIAVSPAALHLDLVVMFAVSVACLPIFFTGQCIARWEGAVFLGYYVAYTAFLLLTAGRSPAAPLLGLALVTTAIPLTVLTLVITTLRARRR